MSSLNVLFTQKLIVVLCVEALTREHEYRVHLLVLVRHLVSTIKLKEFYSFISDNLKNTRVDNQDFKVYRVWPLYVMVAFCHLQPNKFLGLADFITYQFPLRRGLYLSDKRYLYRQFAWSVVSSWESLSPSYLELIREFKACIAGSSAR